ncbi:hypothetical protein BH20GEM1_BH20GEM1_00730 [soil metagenome]
MRYETAAAFRAALEARLAHRSANSGEAIGRLRKRVVFERFLSRLQKSVPGKWVLKGALAIEYRIGSRARTTMDADLSGWREAEQATAAMLTAATSNQPDHFTFRIERVEQQLEAGALRFRLHAELAGRLFDTVIVDVGVGSLELFEPELRQGPGLLEFAGIPAAEIPVQRVEQQIAEKLHAYNATLRWRTSEQPAEGSGRSLPDRAHRGALQGSTGHRLGQDLPASWDPRPPAEISLTTR